jgi:hypothetical protein
VTDLPQGGIEPGLKLGDRGLIPRRRPPAAGRSLRQAKSRFSASPSSLATTAADLPLACQFRTASNLKVAANLRRGLIGDALMMVSMLLDLPSALSEKSKQPQQPVP